MKSHLPQFYYSDNAHGPVEKLKAYLDYLNEVAPQGHHQPYPYTVTEEGLAIPGQAFIILANSGEDKLLKALKGRVTSVLEGIAILDNIDEKAFNELKDRGVNIHRNLYGFGTNSHTTKPPDPPPPPVGQSINLYHLMLPKCLVHQPNLTKINPEELVIGILDSGIDTFYFGQQFCNYMPTSKVIEEKARGDQDQYQYLYWDGRISGYNTVGDNIYTHYQPSYLDDHGHGTAVAKIIKNILAAELPKGLYRILPIKVLDHNLISTEAAVLQGLRLAKRHGVKLINCSFGFPYPLPTIENFIRDNPDMIFVASMGNGEYNVDNISNYPSNYAETYANVFEVMALSFYQHYHLYRDHHGIAPFANYSVGRKVFGAPGMEVPGMNPTYTLGVASYTNSPPPPSSRFVNYSPYPGFETRRPVYSFMDGSSMSAAYLTGAIATLLAPENNNPAQNNYSAAQVRTMLTTGSDRFVLHNSPSQESGVKINYFYNPHCLRQ